MWPAKAHKRLNIQEQCNTLLPSRKLATCSQSRFDLGLASSPSERHTRDVERKDAFQSLASSPTKEIVHTWWAEIFNFFRCLIVKKRLSVSTYLFRQSVNSSSSCQFCCFVLVWYEKSQRPISCLNGYSCVNLCFNDIGGVLAIKQVYSSLCILVYCSDYDIGGNTEYAKFFPNENPHHQAE